MANTVLNDFPALFMAYNGYGPFTPGASIFAGGCQGPLYSNPTTLIMPFTGFNPGLYPNLTPTRYTMKTEPDFYEGIGIGNPGIKYGNPGHILGILDTYCRMSYGLNILFAARTVSPDSNTGEAIPVLLPFEIVGGDVVFVGSDDIYPAFADKPDAYINASVDVGGLQFDSRTNPLLPFVFDGTKYTPETAAIDFPSLFNNVTLNSYALIVPQFRALFDQLVGFADQFSIENEEFLGNDIVNMVGLDVSTTPRVLDPPTGFTNLAGLTANFTSFQPVIWKQLATTLETSGSLNLLTGSPEFHQVNDQLFEYRSLTELNAVVNILPIQTHAMKFAFGKTTPLSNPRVQDRYFISFVITDVMINIINFGDSETVNINGSSEISFSGILHTDPIFRPNLSDPGNPILVSPEYDAELGRQFLFSTSHNNLYTWDRAWLGVEEFNDTVNQYGEFRDFGAGATRTRTFNFDQTITLKPGNNVIQARLVTQANDLVLFAESTFDTISTEINIVTSNGDIISHSFNVNDSIIDPDEFA